MKIELILNNEHFDNIWLLIFGLYFISCFIVKLQEIKVSGEKYGYDPIPLICFGIWIIIIYLILSRFISYLFERIVAIILMIFMVRSLSIIPKILKINLIDFKNSDKDNYIFLNLLYIFFFFHNIQPFGITNQYLLLMYIAFKIFSFSFIVIIDVIFIVLNISKIFEKQIKKYKTKLEVLAESTYLDIYYYEYNLSRKYERNKLIKNLLFIVDVLIYFVLYPFCVFLNLAASLVAFLISKGSILILEISDCFNTFAKNSSKIFSPLIKISSILTLIIIYIITVCDKNIGGEVTEVCRLLITVILIPIIYDSIKNKKTS